MAEEEYDVMLSFRGKDSRKTLVGHLHDRLTREGLKVFLDSQNIGKGRHIDDSINHAIDHSRILIVILSRNYAESKCCLNEALRISQSRGTVIPIFYHVDPAEVCDESKGSFAGAFEKHRRNGTHGQETILSWQKALKDVCSNCGWSLQNDFDGYEIKLVNDVVSNVLSILEGIKEEYRKGAVGLLKYMATSCGWYFLGRCLGFEERRSCCPWKVIV